MEKAPQMIPGRWIWKDDAVSLEFMPSTMQIIDSKDKKTRKKTLIVEQNNRHDRVTPNLFNAKALPVTGISGPSKSQKHEVGSTKSAKGKETVVTLNRVKAVTLNLLHGVNVNTEVFEEALFELDQFNAFLYGLLNYFAAFFDKLVLSKPKQAMSSEPSHAELQAKAQVETSLSNAKRKLARSYSVLLLGIGLPENHHMGCGGHRVSSTHRDRAIYEALYQFCIGFIWIAFYRKEHELINQEIGRLLRSNVFNPALRVKQSGSEDDKNIEPKDDDSSRMITSSKLMEKRPAIMSIINKRSPAIVSLLPTPKENNEWLFRRIDTAVPNKEDEAGKPTSMKRNVGIIGEPLHLFNPMSLAPLDSEQEEENTSGKQTDKDGILPGTRGKNGQTTGRQMTAQSQTTDVFTDDEDP